jgi:hypothetical protein
MEGLQTWPKKEYCEFLDWCSQRSSSLGLNYRYRGEAQSLAKKKLFTYFEVVTYLNKKPTRICSRLLANDGFSGEAWALSYRWASCFNLIDTFQVPWKNMGLWLKVISVSEKLLKRNQRNTPEHALYCVLLTADKYQGCQLQPLHTRSDSSATRACPTEAGHSRRPTPEANFKLTLEQTSGNTRAFP